MFINNLHNLSKFEISQSAYELIAFVSFQVISVKMRHPGLQKISFVAHSLGGLIARYAVARLYEPDIMENGNCRTNGPENPCVEEISKERIAGLKPINFITSATPHLGTRGHRQVRV